MLLHSNFTIPMDSVRPYYVDLMAVKQGLKVCKEDFQNEMKSQQERAPKLTNQLKSKSVKLMSRRKY